MARKDYIDVGRSPSRQAHCAAAESDGLTEREREVLTLIAKGSSGSSTSCSSPTARQGPCTRSGNGRKRHRQPAGEGG